MSVPRAEARVRRRAHVSAVALALCVAATSAAEEGAPADVPSAEYDVYVTSERDVVGAVSTVREIDRATLRQEQARDLEEALQHQPSLVIRRGGEGVARVDMRGLRTRQILLLLDGVPLRTTSDGNFDPDLVPSQIIESIDVSYGASSVLYGDGPLAGVIQVKTRTGEGGVEAEAQGDVRDGSQFLGEGGVLGGTESTSAFAAGSFRTAEGYEMSEAFVPTPLENGRLRENADRQQGNFFTKLGWSPGERGRVDLLFDYHAAEFGVPWSTVADPNDPFAQRARFERMNDLDGFTLQLSGQVDATDALELRSWGYAARQVEQYASYDGTSLATISQNGTFSLQDTATIGGGAVHARQDFGDAGVLRVALNGRYEQLDTLGFTRTRIGGGGGGGGTVVSVPVDRENGYGAWSLGAEYELSPIEPVGLVLGYAHAFLEARDPIDTDGSIFLAGAHWDVTKRTRLRAAASQKLRFPSIRQLFDVDGGNPFLGPESCWCYEAAVEQQLPWHSRLDVIGYWMDLEGFIERPGAGTLYANRQTLRHRGFEVAATSAPVEPLALRFGYTFLDADDLSPFSALAGPMENRPRHKLDGTAQYTFPTETSLRAALTWGADTLIYTRTAPRIASYLSDFVVLDLMVEQRIGGDRVRVYLGVQNVTDELWTYNYGFPQAGRTVFGGVELRTR